MSLPSSAQLCELHILAGCDASVSVFVHYGGQTTFMHRHVQMTMPLTIIEFPVLEVPVEAPLAVAEYGPAVVMSVPRLVRCDTFRPAEISVPSVELPKIILAALERFESPKFDAWEHRSPLPCIRTLLAAPSDRSIVCAMDDTAGASLTSQAPRPHAVKRLQTGRGYHLPSVPPPAARRPASVGLPRSPLTPTAPMRAVSVHRARSRSDSVSSEVSSTASSSGSSTWSSTPKYFSPFPSVSDFVARLSGMSSVALMDLFGRLFSERGDLRLQTDMLLRGDVSCTFDGPRFHGVCIQRQCGLVGLALPGVLKGIHDAITPTRLSGVVAIGRIATIATPDGASMRLSVLMIAAVYRKLHGIAPGDECVYLPPTPAFPTVLAARLRQILSV